MFKFTKTTPMKSLILVVLLSMTIINATKAQDEFYRLYSFEYIDNYISFDTIPDNLWEIAKPQKIILDQAYSDSLVMITLASDFYQASNTSIFEFTFTIPDTSSGLHDMGSGKIKFKHKFDTEIGTAGGFIEISYDNGESWTNVVSDITVGAGKPELINMYTENDSLDDGTMCFQGITDDWIQSSVTWWWNMAVKIDQPEGWGWQWNDTLKIRFVFKSLDWAYESHEGWMIDDLEVFIARIYGDIDEFQTNSIRLYPNPANNYITVENINNSNPSSINIISLSGEIVYSEPQNQQSVILVDISNLKTGMYFISVKNSSEFNYKKFVKY